MPPYGTPQPYNPYRLPTTPLPPSSGDVSLWRSLTPSPTPQAPRRTATPSPSEIRGTGGIPISSLPTAAPTGGIPISSLPTAAPSGGIPIASLPTAPTAPAQLTPMSLPQSYDVPQPQQIPGMRPPAGPTLPKEAAAGQPSARNEAAVANAAAEAADRAVSGGTGQSNGAGRGSGSYGPEMFEPGSVLNWSDQEVADITEATVGRTLSKQEFMNWIDAFTREHGQTPWQTGPFDAANNLIDHLIALGDSERQAGKGQTVNWEGLYYNRYAAPTYTPGYEQNTDKDDWQRLVPGQMPTPNQPWWLMQGAMGNPNWYMGIRRPWFGG